MPRRRARYVLVPLLALLSLTATGCTTLPFRGGQLLRAVGGYEEEAEPVGGEQFERALDASLDSATHEGTAVKLLQNGDEAYPVMLALIEAAKERISFETYIVCKDETTDKFFEALRAAARRGVEVRLLADAAGFDRGLVANLGDMEMDNLQARVFNPFLLSWTLVRGNNRDHRKILVVDGRYAVMGGINLSDAQLGDGVSGWRDTALLATGPAAADAEKIFAETWEQAGRGWVGKDLPLTALNPVKRLVDMPIQRIGESVTGRGRFTPPEYAEAEDEDIFGKEFYDSLNASVRAVGSSPDGWTSRTHDLALAGIRGARERIDAAYAYFVPTGEMRHALIAAAKRGVRVRLLLPGVTDVRFVRELGVKRYGELLEAGVEIYEWPHKILHAKTMAVDGMWLMAGSANMDGRSYFLNYEAVFAVRDAAVAEIAHAQFEKDMKESSRVTPESWRNRGTRQRMLETLLTPLAGQF